jgi:hypothetical protein
LDGVCGEEEGEEEIVIKEDEDDNEIVVLGYRAFRVSGFIHAPI